MSENLGLNIEVKSTGEAQVVKNLDDVKNKVVRNVKEIENVSANFYNTQTNLARDWFDAADKRIAERAREERIANQAISKSTRNKLAEIKAVEDADFRTWQNQQKEKVAYQKILAGRDTGMGPRDSHVQLYKKLQADQLALEKANAVRVC
ncbi:MAG: hypothetical protein IPP74_13380 [Alphaproteobacteria bacterium]|nr:hypothetical protein [Alphaproteobacteria bacterium]